MSLSDVVSDSIDLSKVDNPQEKEILADFDRRRKVIIWNYLLNGF